MRSDEDWLTIHDSEISSAELAAEIARRVQKTEERSGELKLILPSFGEISSFPKPPADRLYNPLLYHHLRRANELAPPATNPVLVPSPATRIPILGRIWQLIRRQVHELVLFYVNRLGAYEANLDSHIISSLNELTRLVEEQQEEIIRLQKKLVDRDKTE